MSFLAVKAEDVTARASSSREPPFLVPLSYIAENYSWKRQGWLAPQRSPACPSARGKMSCNYAIPETRFSNIFSGTMGTGWGRMRPPLLWAGCEYLPCLSCWFISVLFTPWMIDVFLQAFGFSSSCASVPFPEQRSIALSLCVCL